MLHEPAELLKAANAMAEATKQAFFDEMVISLTRATLRASGDLPPTRGNRDPGRRFDRREWPHVSHGRKRPPRAARAAMIDMIGSRKTRGLQRAQSSPGGCLSTHRQPGPATRRACASQQPRSKQFVVGLEDRLGAQGLRYSARLRIQHLWGADQPGGWREVGQTQARQPASR